MRAVKAQNKAQKKVCTTSSATRFIHIHQSCRGALTPAPPKLKYCMTEICRQEGQFGIFRAFPGVNLALFTRRHETQWTRRTADKRKRLSNSAGEVKKEDKGRGGVGEEDKEIKKERKEREKKRGKKEK